MRDVSLNCHQSTMSQRMRKHAHFLSVLAKGNSKQQRGIIEGASNDLIQCLCECCFNILRGSVPLSSNQKKKLSKYKHHLRTLSNKKVSTSKKRKLLTQKGGFISAILGPVLSALGSLLFK